MVRIVILVGTILWLGSRLAETLSPQCRCRNHNVESSRFKNLSGNCELTPTIETQTKFNNSVKRTKIFILLNITFVASNCERQISNSHSDCNDTNKKLKDVLFPYQWTWVYQGENGMFPLMTYPYDYNIHSLWTLNRTKVTIDAVLAIPDNCKVTIGEKSLFRKVFRGLNKMAEKVMKPDWSGFLCYNIDNSQSMGDFSLLIHHYFGFVRGITVKYCCPLQTESYEDQIKFEKTGSNLDYELCTGEVVPSTSLMDLTTILGSVMFIFLPFILCFFLKEEPQLNMYAPDNNHEWINTNDGIFCFQHLILWISWWHYPSLTASRIRRVFFIILSPSIVYYHILAENYYMSDIQKEYLKKDIPLGVKSIFFGFADNYKNTYHFFGGTFIWGSIYFTLSIILICIPNNVGDGMIGNLSLQRKYSPSFLILDTATLKEYSSIDISGHKNYRLVYETLKANLLLVLNSKFWIAIFFKWKTEIENLWTVQHTCISTAVNIFFTPIYIFLFLAEVLTCLFYYSFPMLFVFLSINVAIYDKLGCFWFDKMSERFNRVPHIVLCGMFVCSICTTTIILLNTFCLMCYICVCSFFIFNLTVMFTLIGVIITPEIIGYISYLLSAMLYINIIYKGFTERYNTLLELVAKTPSAYVVNNKNIQFIRRDFFYDIVDNIRPLRAEIFLLLSKYFFLFLYLTLSFNIIQKFQLSLQYTEKFLSCLLITQVPLIAINILSRLTVDSHQEEFNEKKKVKRFLKEYNNTFSESC